MKDLTKFLDPALPIRLEGHTYTVQPPSTEVGLKLTALNTAGMSAYLAATGQCPTCGRTGDLTMDDETQTIIESLRHTPLGELSLGKDVYDRMVADGLPGKHIDKAALYAMYFWVLGETSADKIMQALADQTGVEASGATAPKASRSGRSTASGRQTKTASTRTTASPRT